MNLLKKLIVKYIFNEIHEVNSKLRIFYTFLGGDLEVSDVIFLCSDLLASTALVYSR